MQKVDLFKILSSNRGPALLIRLARRKDGAVIEVDAASLLVQYQLGTGDVLLVLDEDTPFEEQLHLVLVRGAAIVDQLVIGAPYVDGIFREVEARGDRLSFRFEGDAVWTVGLDSHVSRMPVSLPSGSRRRGGWLARRYLSLSRKDVA